MSDQPAADNEAKRRAIEVRAYFIWETKGKPHGCDLDHWLQAEAELVAATRATEANSPEAEAAA
jgi:hypothetical protein